MLPPDLISLFVVPLNKIGITYMVTGSVASGLYSHERFTTDIDLVVILSNPDAAKLHAAFDNPDFYVPPLEVIQIERQRPAHGHFNLIHNDTGFKADIFFAGEDRLNERALELRRKEIDANGETVWFAPPEYVILNKLQYLKTSGSPKHITDIQGMLEARGDQFDHELLRTEVNALGLHKEWELVNPPKR